MVTFIPQVQVRIDLTDEQHQKISEYFGWDARESCWHAEVELHGDEAVFMRLVSDEFEEKQDVYPFAILDEKQKLFAEEESYPLFKEKAYSERMASYE